MYFKLAMKNQVVLPLRNERVDDCGVAGANPLTNQADRTIMRSMKSIAQILFLMLGSGYFYSGSTTRPQLCVRVTLTAKPLTAMACSNSPWSIPMGTTTYWSNDGTSVDGSEPQASVAVAVSGGLYARLTWRHRSARYGSD